MGGLRHDDDGLLTQCCCMFDESLEVCVCVFCKSFFFSVFRSPEEKLFWFMRRRKRGLSPFACLFWPSCSLILSMNILNMTVIYSSWPCAGLLGEGGCGDSCTSGLVLDSFGSGRASSCTVLFQGLATFSWSPSGERRLWPDLAVTVHCRKGFCLNGWRGEEKVFTSQGQWPAARRPHPDISLYSCVFCLEKIRHEKPWQPDLTWPPIPVCSTGFPSLSCRQ